MLRSVQAQEGKVTFEVLQAVGNRLLQVPGLGFGLQEPRLRSGGVLRVQGSNEGHCLRKRL